MTSCRHAALIPTDCGLRSTPSMAASPPPGPVHALRIRIAHPSSQQRCCRRTAVRGGDPSACQGRLRSRSSACMSVRHLMSTLTSKVSNCRRSMSPCHDATGPRLRTWRRACIECTTSTKWKCWPSFDPVPNHRTC